MEIGSAIQSMQSAYEREYPDQIFRTFAEVRMAAEMLGILVRYYALVEEYDDVVNTLDGLESLVHDVNQNSPFTECEKAKLDSILDESNQVYAKSRADFAHHPESGYDHFFDLSDRLLASVEDKSDDGMLSAMDALESAYQKDFGEALDSFDAVKAFFYMKYASLKCLSYNNFYELCRPQYQEVKDRYDRMILDSSCFLSEVQKSEIGAIMTKIDNDAAVYLNDKRRNRFVHRLDCKCVLCRKRIANETGSHMVPNFLARETFSYDGSKSNDREALDFSSLNSPEANSSFYGREVPGERIAITEGRIYTDEDLDGNVNLLMYDNEFCKLCEKRFAVLETAYSEYYSGRKKSINPRVAYLFWLSVLWRMSMGSMSIFIKMEEELQLRHILDAGLLESIDAISQSSLDLGTWQYVIYQCNELKKGDKGIIGSRQEYSPYIFTVNDLIVVCFSKRPLHDMKIASLQIKLEDLQDWSIAPKPYIQISRRDFWDVRDWLVQTSYEYYDPYRERVLREIREKERSEDRVISEGVKALGIDMAHSMAGPLPKNGRIRKMDRVLAALKREMDATAKGEPYDKLNDEELFLQQSDFDNFYSDIKVAGISKRKLKAFLKRLPSVEVVIPGWDKNEAWHE